MTPTHLQNTYADHSSNSVKMIMSYNHSKYDILSMSVCVCVLFGAWHKVPLMFSHVMRPWLVEAVKWRTTVSSYTKDTHTQSQNICSIWKISLIFLSFQRYHKGRNARTHSHAGAVDPQVTVNISENGLKEIKIFYNATCFSKLSLFVSSLRKRTMRGFRPAGTLIKKTTQQSADCNGNMVRHSICQ